MTFKQALVAAKAINLELIKDKLLISYPEPRVEKMISAYREFLAFTATSEKPVGPTGDVDIVWHEHILHMQKYLWDCFNAFGRTIFHFPFSEEIRKKMVWDANCSGTTNCQDSPDCSNADRGHKASLDSEGNLVLVIKKPAIDLDNPKIESLSPGVIFAAENN